jgi:phospholipid/cholesterol/gamma-HCH transport system permease protein
MNAQSLPAFAWAVLRAQMAFRPTYGQWLLQIHEATIHSLFLVAVLSFFGGLNLVVQSYDGFARIGGHDLLGLMVAVGGVRELFPVMAAVVCGAKLGAAMAASLGNMRLSEQIEALEVMGVEPFSMLVGPRVWALCVALPLLCIWAYVIGIASSWLAAVYQLHRDSGFFFEQLQANISFYDLATGVCKSLIMGWVVATIACYHGYYLDRREGAGGVGRVANAAIVQGALACIVLNLALSLVFYGES